MCHNLQNHDSHLVFQEIRKYNFEINVMPGTVEKYMSFTIQQPKWEGTEPGLPLVFIDSDHFLNNSLDSLVKNVGNNDFYHLSKELNANVLDLHKKKGFGTVLTMIIGKLLRKSKKDYPAKINLVIHSLIMQLVIKTMNMFLKFGKIL